MVSPSGSSIASALFISVLSSVLVSQDFFHQGISSIAGLSQRVLPQPTASSQGRRLQEIPNDSSKIRIFGPISEQEINTPSQQEDGVSFTWYTTQQQRQFLQQHGRDCWKSSEEEQDDNRINDNPLTQRFDELASSPFLQAELWKFCVFHTLKGNVYWDRAQVVPLLLWQDMWQEDPEDQSMALLVSTPSETAASGSSWIHSSLMRLDAPYAKRLSENMLRLLMDTEDLLLTSNPLYTYQAMAQHIQNETPTNVWKAKCLVPSPRNPVDDVLVQRHAPNKKKESNKFKRYSRSLEPQIPPEFSRLPAFGLHCTIPGGYCCQVWNNEEEEIPALMVKHPFGTTGGLTKPTPPKETSSAEVTAVDKSQRQQYPTKPDPYYSTITAVPNGIKDSVAISKLETPNFFDILFQNNCLPTSDNCHKCLKRYTHSTGCDDQCKQECPCYCKVLCQIRPPPKHIQAVWYVSPPLLQLPTYKPPRLIPRLVHQTWYEPLEKEKYPNMSRLQQSWKQSGWEHTFYDDASAARFLFEHFPPQVLEAYHAIQPGAFKADLFRYCCLLIKGGVYADMDVLLETNLEEAIDPDVGFMTPMDEPGIKVGQQACLWNGLMAVAPGHPFVAKTLELVVNNIRNRFTSVDYDDMLCPDPVLSASHLWDILFTTGPCILGTAMNLVLQRHPQTGFTAGELDIWGPPNNDDKSHKSKPPPMVEPDDPRLAIPGRSIILRQNKEDIGAHRFTLIEKNLIICSTDMPDYDDRPPKPHYAESGRQTALYGTTQLYSDFVSANEEVRIVVVGNPNNFTL